jgi:hypothetical protein
LKIGKKIESPITIDGTIKRGKSKGELSQKAFNLRLNKTKEKKPMTKVINGIQYSNLIKFGKCCFCFSQ